MALHISSLFKKYLVCGGVLFAAVVVFGLTVPPAAGAQNPAIIIDAQAKWEKKLQKPQRISSNLLGLKEQRATSKSSGNTDSFREWIKYVDGLPEIEVWLKSSDPAAVQEAQRALESMGMTITRVSQKYGRIYGTMDLNTIDDINDIPFLSMANPTYKPISWYGSVDSEGDAAMETQLIRASEGIDGDGVTIGVMSDSFDAGGDGFASVVENGDLPGPGNPNGYTTPVTILADSAEGANEGRAMAEIIHDVAPGAGLVFYSAFLGPTAFADAFTALTAYGADIIVDDVGYLTEPCFQDGIIAQAAQAAADRGVMVFSSSGNTADHSVDMMYQDIDPDQGDSFYTMGNDLHDFGQGNPFAEITVGAGRSIRATLWWNEPYDGTLGPGASTDLDLYLLDADSGKIVTASNTSQGCSFGQDDVGGNPYEFLGYTNEGNSPATVLFIVDHVCGNKENLRLKLTVFGSASTVFDASLFTKATTFGHPAASGVIAVGAVDYRETDAFNATPRNPVNVEYFTSLGDRLPFYFDENGHLLRDAPVERSKPEIAAPDGVSTSTEFFETFFGTSAAAPHAAAMAALLLEAAPDASSLMITDCMRAGAIDVGEPRRDGYSGNGLINGPNALSLLMAGGQGVYAIDADSGAHGSVHPAGRLIGFTPGPASTLPAHEQVFTFIPDAHYHVADVLINGESQGAMPDYTFSGVTEDQTLRVEFAADTFSITATAGTGGRISPSGVVALTHADSRTFTMAADVGYTLSDVQVDGVSVGPLESVLFTDITDHHTIEAFFTRNSYFVTTETHGLGTISPPETQAVDHGGSLTYTIASGEGYHIEQILINGTSAGGSDQAVFSLFLSHIVEETLIRADFGINTYTLTPVTDAHCRVEPADPQVVDHGSTQTFDIRPNPNYQIEDVLVDGISVGPVDTYTFTDVRAEHRLEVLVVEENSGSGGPCFISAVPGF